MQLLNLLYLQKSDSMILISCNILFIIESYRLFSYWYQLSYNVIYVYPFWWKMKLKKYRMFTTSIYAPLGWHKNQFLTLKITSWKLLKQVFNNNNAIPGITSLNYIGINKCEQLGIFIKPIHATWLNRKPFVWSQQF